jgi:anti-anti-sigma factor
MNVTTSINGNIASLRMSGRFEFSAHREFRDAYEALLSNDQVRYIQLHMSQIDYIDSAALGMLLIIREKANYARKSVSLSSPSAAVKQVLEIANFEKLFAIC